MTKLLKDLGKNNSGSSIATFALLAGTVSLTYVVGSGATDCFCMQPITTDLISMNTVERFFGTVFTVL